MAQQKLLRQRGAADDGKVSYLELFFDLVFVFSITQISHLIAYHYTPAGVAEGAILMLAIWWLWIFTTWAMNWLDPKASAVRAMLFAMMLAGLVLSASIPDAWGSQGLVFALAFVAMQVGRSLFMAWVFLPANRVNSTNFLRISAWLAFSGVFWIAGALSGHELRLYFWLAALAIEYASPAAGFWVPGLGASKTETWDISGAHMAERCALFVIICLGESIIVSGKTFAESEPSLGLTAAFLADFATTCAMWWIYFHFGHERATHLIEQSEDPGRIGRSVFTYAHIPIVAGIILSAVGAEFSLAHPQDAAHWRETTAMVGGPVLFLLGVLWFKGMTTGRMPLSHMGGLAILAAIALLHFFMPLHALAMAVAAALAVVAVWEIRGQPQTRANHH